jgi:nucleotide-binding universal stress UspA family protein
MQNDPAGTEPCPFGNALVGVDGTPRGRDAIALAERLRAPRGRMTLASVVLLPSPTYRNFHATPVWRKRRAMLERERDVFGVAAELTGTFAASVGSGLHQLAEDYDADLLVVGSSGRGRVGRVLGGDDARGTVSGATCPVAVAPQGYADRAGPIRTVGVGYDGSAEAKASLAVARKLADANARRLVALTVVRPVAGAAGRREGAETKGTLEQPARDLLASLEGVEGHVAIGAPASELVAFGDRVDLLVVGSRGHGPLRRLALGSTSLPLIREARCSLLVIPRPAVAEYLPRPAI